MVGGGVYQPPHLAARSLTCWAIDLWPYVNGKAIMSGVALLDLDAESFLDVIHYLFETDITSISTNEQLQVQTSTRKALYRDMYNITYKYGHEGSTATRKYTSAAGDETNIDDNSDMVPLDPLKRKTAAFVPATIVDENSAKPFGNVLDGHLG